MTDDAHETNRDLVTGAGVTSGKRVGKQPAKASRGQAERDSVWSSLAFRFLVVLLGAGFLLHLGLVSSERFGGYYDDTIYVTAAKSLATGEGYRIISLPQPVAQTLIPPVYPLVLSIIWRVYPGFPENLVWMMLLTVALMMGFGLMTWWYLVMNRYATRWQALVVVTLTIINWRMMSLGTSIISEVLFALLSVAALHLAEKYEKEKSILRTGAVMGLIAALAVYYLYRRRWKKMLVSVSIALLFVVGWFGWCYLNGNTGGGEHASYYAGYARGISDTVARLQTLDGGSKLTVYLKIIETNAMGLIVVWAPLQSLGLRATLPTPLLVPLILLVLTLLFAGFVREIRSGVRLLEIYCVCHLCLHIIVPSHSYERYIMPIVPFLLFFLVRELSVLFSTLRTSLISHQSALAKAPALVIGIVVIGFAGVALLSNWTGIYRALTDPKPGGGFKQDAQTFEWIKANTEAASVLICFGDLKYFLYTGRKTVRSIPVNVLDLTVYQAKEPDPDELTTMFLNIVDENRGNYVVLTPNDFREQAPAYGAGVEAYITAHPEQFVPVFQSEDGSNRVYQIRDSGRRQS